MWQRLPSATFANAKQRAATPVLQNANRQRFFPVESVCAIGEVKSVLSVTDLKVALRKLAEVKLLRDFLSDPSYVYCAKESGLRSKFEPQCDERDQLVTFLLCERFDFDFAKNMESILSCYGEEHPKYPANVRHNFVLSIKDGLLTYIFSKEDGVLYPFSMKLTDVFDCGGTDRVKSISAKPRTLTNRFIKPSPGSYEHIRHFSSLLHQALTTVSVLFPEMGKYIPSQDEVQYKDIEPIRGF
ncbi:MAG: hypothetical protein KGL90_09950 [Burkholderiales bacterium]|nr:hypothetical protein [Burkholderiales bacterium]